MLLLYYRYDTFVNGFDIYFSNIFDMLCNYSFIYGIMFLSTYI